MLEQLFPRHYPRYEASVHSHDLRTFANWLVRVGYGPEPAHGHVRRLRQVLEPAGRALGAQVPGVELDRLFAAMPRDSLFVATQRAFSRCLAAHDRLLPEADVRPHGPVLAAYKEQLTAVRGLAASTVTHHMNTAEVFLNEALPPGMPISGLSRSAVERHVVAMGNRISRQSMQHCVAHLRSFLRFCHARGLLLQPLDAIDTPRVYRDELPPRALPWPTVLQLLRSIDRRQGKGCRDYAILHLVSHYGLRPCEVAALRLDSIDWEACTLRVEQRKTSSALTLPLASRTVRILQHYLLQGRPPSDRQELFLRARCPSGPLGKYAVGEVYRDRADRSGLVELRGTSVYSLRHTFAMRLLDRGVGIKLIGDVLGHRALESTCVYLRLQLDALRDVALPLPSATPAGQQGAQR